MTNHSDFGITIADDRRELHVAVRVPPQSCGPAGEAFVMRVIRAFAVVENRRADEMRDLLFESGSVVESDGSKRFFFNRPYTDPGYLTQFEVALLIPEKHPAPDVIITLLQVAGNILDAAHDTRGLRAAAALN
jgi:hypothetical protein